MEGYELTESPARRRSESIHAQVLDEVADGRENAEHGNAERLVHDDVRDVQPARGKGGSGTRTRGGGKVVVRTATV